MQAIHMAAQGGHTDIIDALVNDYHVDPNDSVSSKTKIFLVHS